MKTGTAGQEPTSDAAAVTRSLLVAEVMAQLAQTMDAEVAVGRLAKILVPALADWCVVTMIDDDESRAPRRRLRDIGSWHVDPGMRKVVREYAAERLAALGEESFLSQAIARGVPIQVRADATAALHEYLAPGTAYDLLSRLAPASVVVVPLITRGRTLGALSLFNGPGRDAVSNEELTTLRRAAASAAIVLDNARLYRRQRAVAQTFQRSLLTAPMEPDGARIVVRYQPAAEATRVGGDWYDAFVQPDGSTLLVIGDVVGHDIEAAALMSELRSMLRAIAVVTGGGPADVLTQLDAAIRTLDMPSMATVVVARLEQDDDERARGVTRVRWSSAGHPPPMTLDSDGKVQALTPSRQGPLLGILPDAVRAEDEVVLDPGTTLLLYTDGLVESRARPLRDGLDELEQMLERLRDQELDVLCDTLLTDLPAGQLEDDVALVAVRLHRMPAAPR